MSIGDTPVTVVGNLTADPELRNLPSGANVVNFTVAANRREWDRQANEWKDAGTVFMRCSAWDAPYRPLASNVAQSLSKGQRVICRGILLQRSWQDKDGANRTSIELRADAVGADLSNQMTVSERNPKPSGGQGGASTGYQGGASGFAGAARNHPPSPQSQAGEANQDPWGHPADYGAAPPADGFDEPEF